MSRKKKSRNKSAKKRSLEVVVRDATDHLAQGSFRDAAADYKQLLKNERRPEWVAGLADAYAGRAQHLASRGMIKEAIALWQNRAETCDKSLADPRYLQWLIAAGRTSDIGRLYHQDAVALAGIDGVAALQARLAAAALSDGGELVRQLASDDPVARDFPAANAALIAYAQGDDEAMQTALSQIAFRSPYRDFRQLLKTLVRHEQEPAAATRMRIPANSPFAGLMQALRAAENTASSDAAVDIAAIDALSNSGQAVLAALVGWSANQQNLLRQLTQLGPQPSPDALFEFVLAHRKVLGKDYARQAAFMLAGDNVRLHDRLRKEYPGLSGPDALRLLAVFSEHSGEPMVAISQWQTMIDLLNEEPIVDATDALRRALIHRHIAGLIMPSTDSLPLDEEAADHLAASLDLDASDQPSYLRLVDHYLHVNELKNARHWANRALTQFPDDPDCLFRAAQTAVAGKAFKKAASYAQRILAVDSINADARGLLVDSHLGHARKQIKARKATAAHREINTAADFARGSVDMTRIAVLGALTTLACDDASAATQSLTTAVEHADNALVGYFLLLLEAHRAGIKLPAVIRAAALPDIKALGQIDHVLALVDTLGSLRTGQVEQAAVEAALKKLAPALNEAAKTRLERDHAQRVCETLLRYHQYAPLKRYARTALNRWPDDPLITFFWTLGGMAGRRLHPVSREREDLERAFEDAQTAGDTRTAQRIGVFLDEMTLTLPPLGPNPFRSFEDIDLPPDSSDQYDFDIDKLRILLELFLPPIHLERLDDAVRNGEPVPPDIIEMLESAIDAPIDGPQPKTQTGSKPKRQQKKQPEKNPNQYDLFGDEW